MTPTPTTPAPASAPSPADIAPDEFDFLARLVEARCAIVMERGKEYLVQSRLGPVLRSENLAGYGELVDALRREPHGDLERRIIDAMTTNETSFFRDAHPFDAISEHLIPELLARRPGRVVTIWCGACSSGQEPYSLAMIVAERFPDLVREGRVQILATDLSPTMVERTKLGRYSSFEVNRGLPARRLVEHFDQVGREWVVKPHLARLVDARQLNLLESWSGIPRCDIVLLRNVLIYFTHETKQAILRRVRREVLAPGGALFLGSSETTFNIDSGYERREFGKSIYYRQTEVAP